jgi:MarR family transcriptional regulator, organic hydroperoxide resistance regulator
VDTVHVNSSSNGDSTLSFELRMSKPFRSPAQEVALGLLRTASVLSRAMTRAVEPAGLSLAQFNVLRILRSAGADGLATLAIRERMIEEGASITRLIDKLEAVGLVRRGRTTPDRRQVVCTLTEEGQRTIDRLAPLVDAAEDRLDKALSAPELRALSHTLDAARGVFVSGRTPFHHQDD